ncbi:MAG: hypothetical protein MUF79_03915 [Burkholderiales bacterium]|jgi:phosphoglycerol transferase MdoB-like AlkP superfamily enzyme|nr:hypothetical protein [Burkholderiales bacterium]
MSGTAIRAGQPAPSVTGPGGLRRIALAVLALFVLNTALNFRNWWPTPAILPDYRIAPEFVLLWLVLLVAVGWRGRISKGALAAVSVAYLALAIGRYGDVTIPGLFGRDINLYWDVPQIPRFLWVSGRELPWWMSTGIVVALVALFVLLYRVVRWAVDVTARVAVPYALRARWTWVATLAATAAVVAHVANVAPDTTWRFVSKPVTSTYWRQATLLATAASASALADALPRAPALEAAMAAPPTDALASLRGRDIKLLFLESYGAMVFDDATVSRKLAPARAQFVADIAASGRLVASAFMRSPTFAGASDLAHLSLLSGIDLGNPRRHDLLITTDRATLVSLFKRAGYQTVGLYPAVSWAWPERAFYGFDLYLEGRDLDYRGPPIGYWKIPDQISIARFEAMHPLHAASPPRFLFFPTITSHLPFGPVPPYQPDWNRLLTDEPFDRGEAERLASAKIDWIDMRPGYIGMFDYTYRWLGGYLRRTEPRESVMVLVGDHQPASNVSGAGASWEVPVHVVTRDPELLARFVALGFRPGIEPQRPALGGLHDLNALLLRAFGGEALGAVHAAAPHAATAAAPRPAAAQ